VSQYLADNHELKLKLMKLSVLAQISQTTA
jgi:hypothetical protein